MQFKENNCFDIKTSQVEKWFKKNKIRAVNKIASLDNKNLSQKKKNTKQN